MYLNAQLVNESCLRYFWQNASSDRPISTKVWFEKTEMLLPVRTRRLGPNPQQPIFSTFVLPVMGKLSWSLGYLDVSEVEIEMGLVCIPDDKPEECTNTGSWIFRTKFHYCFLKVSSSMISSLCWPKPDVKNHTPWSLYYVWISRDVKQSYLV